MNGKIAFENLGYFLIIFLIRLSYFRGSRGPINSISMKKYFIGRLSFLRISMVFIMFMLWKIHWMGDGIEPSRKGPKPKVQQTVPSSNPMMGYLSFCQCGHNSVNLYILKPSLQRTLPHVLNIESADYKN